MKTQALTIEYHEDGNYRMRPALTLHPLGWDHDGRTLTIHVVNVPDDVTPIEIVRLYGASVDISNYGVSHENRTWSVEYADLGVGRIVRKQAAIA